MRKPAIELIARGLVQRGGSILVCRDLHRGHCYLPGGHVEFGECAETALRREFFEETGLFVRVGHLVSIIELLFFQKQRERHELSLVFHVEPEASDGLHGSIASLEPDLAFEWVPLSQLAEAKFLPIPLIALLQANSQSTETASWLSFDERVL